MKTVIVLLTLVAASLADAQSQPPQFTISTFAGNGTVGYSGDGGAATQAELYNPIGVAVDQAGNLIIADFHNVIRKVTPQGIISTIAGNGVAGFSGDGGPATAATLYSPMRVAVDAQNNIYVADTNNYRVRKISAQGIITTYAGNGSASASGDGGQATQAGLNIPRDLVFDASGNLYISSDANVIRKVTPGGIISTVAGNGVAAFAGDGGPATSASLNNPRGLAMDSAGNLYIADATNQRIREVSGGIITTIAGTGATGFAGNGTAATQAEFNGPAGLLYASGNLYIADYGNNRVRVLLPNGTISTVAGNGQAAYAGDGGSATSASLNSPRDVAINSSGAIYVADQGNAVIRLLTPIQQPPAINPNGVVPVYSSSTTLQPGEWASLYGTNLAAQTAVWNGDFPTKLGGATVTVDGKPAYLEVVTPTQINFQVPDDSNTGLVTVVVTTSAGSASATVTLGPYAPSFLLLSARYPAAIVQTNGPGNSGGGYDIIGPSGAFPYASRPVKAGEIVVIYAVGFGPTNPPVPAGQLYAGAAQCVATPQITIGGVTAQVDFAGIVEAGLYQFNVVVPSLPSGDQILLGSIGGMSTQPNIYLTIQ